MRAPVRPKSIAKVKPVTAFHERRGSSPTFGRKRAGTDLTIKNFHEALG